MRKDSPTHRLQLQNERGNPLAATKLKSTTANLLGTDWKIVVRPFGPDHDGSAAQSHGYCDGRAYEVHINESLGAASQPDTLLHELMHAIEAAGGFDTDEPRVRYTATALRQFFRANPKLTEFITK